MELTISGKGPELSGKLSGVYKEASGIREVHMLKKIFSLSGGAVSEPKTDPLTGKNDFKTRKYAGSYLGIITLFIQPIVTVLVYWFVFGLALRAGATAPFRLYCGWWPAWCRGFCAGQPGKRDECADRI